ncbi:MAG: LLM class oxidoreductase, partial [Pseudomonadota bacterium]
VPTMDRHLERIQLAEQLGFAALWLRDVPFNVPSFGDAGHVFDPFVYLGLLAAKTERIALGVASIILPLRHPAHVAKAAASVDVLSGGRLLLGVASGDRPQEYPALNMTFEDRGARFRESFAYIRQMWQNSPAFRNHYGSPYDGMDMLPKPTVGKIPLLITGGSQQDPQWIAQNGEGWMIYPRQIELQQGIISDWRARVRTADKTDKPVIQALYVDLDDNPDSAPRAIHLGFRSGINYLRAYLKSLEAIGVNHVALNLRFNQANIETTLKRLADEILPDFEPTDTWKEEK